MEQAPQLKVSELYTKRQSRDAARLKAYNQILAQIHHRIRVMSKLPGTPSYLMYTIPPFIFGLPRIDMEDCVVYLVYQLRTAGLETRYTYPNLLLISWTHHEKEYVMEQSPILQAMVATAESAKAENGGFAANARAGAGAARVRAAVKPKGGKKVAFGGATSMIAAGGAGSTMMSPSAREPTLKPATIRVPGTMSAGRNPTASDYVPPANFIQTMEKPEREGGIGARLPSMGGSASVFGF